MAFDWPSLKHRRFVEEVCQRNDSVLSAANQGGKTFTGGALAISLARGASHLGDLRLPVLPVPNVGGVGVESHKVQVDSSQAALFHWLGSHPHDVAWLRKAEHVASAIFVATPLCRHGMDVHCRTCSRIVFVSAENADSALGARWDWAWGDEPQPQGMWDEIRKNCRYKWMTETPLERSKWEWIEEQYLPSLDVAKNGRFLIRAGIDDNKYLTDVRKAELIAGYAGSPFKRARMTGEPVDAEGATPWGDLGFERLQQMLGRCRRGEFYEFPLAAAHRSEEKVARLEVWHDYEPDEVYYANVDGSLGIADDPNEQGKKARRDPSGLHVYARRTPRLVARYGGFLVPEVLGHLAAKVGEMYGDALVDVENQGGYGEAVLVGMHHAGYRMVLGGDRKPSAVKGRHALAFETSNVTRGLYIGAFQDLVLHGGIEVQSAEVIRSALSMRVDNTGKLLARSGMHDEDVMLAGRAAHWLSRNPPPVLAVRMTPMDWAGRQIEADVRKARTGRPERNRVGEAWD